MFLPHSLCFHHFCNSLFFSSISLKYQVPQGSFLTISSFYLHILPPEPHPVSLIRNHLSIFDSLMCFSSLNFFLDLKSLNAIDCVMFPFGYVTRMPHCPKQNSPRLTYHLSLLFFPISVNGNSIHSVYLVKSLEVVITLSFLHILCPNHHLFNSLFCSQSDKYFVYLYMYEPSTKLKFSCLPLERPIIQTQILVEKEKFFYLGYQ